jgi:hypothetical protein
MPLATVVISAGLVLLADGVNPVAAIHQAIVALMILVLIQVMTAIQALAINENF